MNTASHEPGQSTRKSPAPAPTHRSSWLGSSALGIMLLSIYLCNGRDIGSDDTFSATLLPLNILRGEGVYLDNPRLGDIGTNKNIPLPYNWTRSHGRVVTLYPIAPALVAIPFVAPQIAFLDFYRPGWDRNPVFAVRESRVIVKNAMAMIVALAGVTLHRLLLALGLRRVALATVLAACLGSDLWTVGSQAPWQHGPAAALLIGTIALLTRRPVGRTRLFLAGLTTAFLVACRLMDVVFAIAILTWVAFHAGSRCRLVPAGSGRRWAGVGRL